MADLTLSDGREITLDLNRITLEEWRNLFHQEQPEEEGDKILARVCGLEAGEIVKLGYLDYRRLTKKFFERAREPLADPS